MARRHCAFSLSLSVPSRSLSADALFVCVFCIVCSSLLLSMTPYRRTFIQQRERERISLSFLSCIHPSIHPTVRPSVGSYHRVQGNERARHCCVRMTCATKGYPKLHPTCLLLLFNPHTHADTHLYIYDGGDGVGGGSSRSRSASSSSSSPPIHSLAFYFAYRCT